MNGMDHRMSIELGEYGARVQCACGDYSPEFTKPQQAQAWIDLHLTALGINPLLF
jgi:hypothetical protein